MLFSFSPKSLILYLPYILSLSLSLYLSLPYDNTWGGVVVEAGARGPGSLAALITCLTSNRGCQIKLGSSDMLSMIRRPGKFPS